MQSYRLVKVKINNLPTVSTVDMNTVRVLPFQSDVIFTLEWFMYFNIST